MTVAGIIGGTGLGRIEGLEIIRHEELETPYGKPSSPLSHGRIDGSDVVFLARHGAAHSIPPHRVNYRANMFALREAGVEQVVAVAAVGGIQADMLPGVLALPNQIIDYTWGRKHSFFDGSPGKVTHIDFTEPYCETLRHTLLNVAQSSDIQLSDGGVYGATQGPRLETAAEIDRMRRDGCTLVGMTGMPEAALARELGLCYASCSVVANRAAGFGGKAIHMEEIQQTLNSAMINVETLLINWLKTI
ncbi:methylthioadenosine phosphorylase [Thiogranum longum]|uniref:Probable S-methyl-5'-thioinosine phosphorylase n=1 Tax=Thiogranum longum TaxID=1537524 RepID=A0A4V6NDB6_9GAMM|nr:S-methyl-5'-thioinosine phosphorylase [Thiogranum longum]TCK18386.1 methylthioadenosine phosphorylase [Thiogranum longum]